MTGPMTERELAEVWSTGASRPMWTRVLERAIEDGDRDSVAVARNALDALPQPLVTLEANADLVQQLTGCRWYVVMSAHEAGSSWEEIAEALHTTVEDARAAYLEAIEQQERYCDGLHDVARARAALDDDPVFFSVDPATPESTDATATVLQLAEKDTREGDVHSANEGDGGDDA